MIIKCDTFRSDLEVELHLSTDKIRADTLKTCLSDGGDFAIIAEFYRKEGSRLIFHPLIIGTPHIHDTQTGDLTWVRYSDFYHVHLEDFKEFSKVKDRELPDSFEEMKSVKERVFKSCLGKILKESTTKDWGGETSDFFTSHLHINGDRVKAAFLLKGPANFTPMTIKHLGRNGDQIVRLTKEPAEILFVQHCHDITTAVIETLKVFATQPSNPRHYCLVDGRESLRLLDAYGLKDWAVEESKKD